MDKTSCNHTIRTVEYVFDENNIEPLSVERISGDILNGKMGNLVPRVLDIPANCGCLEKSRYSEERIGGAERSMISERHHFYGFLTTCLFDFFENYNSVPGNDRIIGEERLHSHRAQLKKLFKKAYPDFDEIEG